MFEYATLPIKTQLVERGVKESGCIALRRRGELNQIIVAVARRKILSEELQNGRHEINDDSNDDDNANKKVNQLQGKKKTEY